VTVEHRSLDLFQIGIVYAALWVVVQFDCHPEPALFAQRRIWAIRAMRRVLCDAITARLDRFPIKLHHYRIKLHHYRTLSILASSISRLTENPWIGRRSGSQFDWLCWWL
jgi:hypothetical protein